MADVCFYVQYIDRT